MINVSLRRALHFKRDKIDVNVEEIKGHLKNRNIKLFQVFKTKMKTLFFIYIIKKKEIRYRAIKTNVIWLYASSHF